MLDLTTPLDYRPELLSRRPEALAWVLAATLAAAFGILRVTQAGSAGLVAVLMSFLLFTAAGTSLANWMDRRTLLRLDTTGVFFENGLRRVRLTWPEIESVRVLPAAAGSEQVQVLGQKAHFEFRTLATFIVNGEEKGRAGFSE